MSLPQQIYIWQRKWDAGVIQGLQDASAASAGWVALTAEVRFVDGQFTAIRVPINFDALRSTGKPVGLALRVGPYAGPFAGDDAVAGALADLAWAVVHEAHAQGVTPSELQIDFDTAQAKLAGYRKWVAAIGRRIAPVPLTITALPSWLDEPAFAALAAAAPNYVLQVHSVEKPAGGPDAPVTLCDPAKARRWVARADRLGVPFRVALPTYGYRMGFDAKGRLLGLWAEGPGPNWPADVTQRDLRADPAAMAELVQAWAADRPINMRGLIWYRLPVGDDLRNWRWATLAAVMAGRAPRAELVVVVDQSQPGLIDVGLRNGGEADAPLMVEVVVQWPGSAGAELPVGDGLGGFELAEVSAGQARFRAAVGLALERLPPAERRSIGWLRLTKDMEVHTHVEPIKP